MKNLIENGLTTIDEKIAQPHSESLFNHNGIEIISGTSNPNLANAVAKILKQEVDKPVTLFDDGEIKVKLTHFLRRKDIFIIQPTSPPVNNHIMELLLMIDAIKRSSAGEITAVIPYYGYSRQDRKPEPKVSISAALIA